MEIIDHCIKLSEVDYSCGRWSKPLIHSLNSILHLISKSMLLVDNFIEKTIN